MGKFKVGDRVRLTEDYAKWVAGTESEIEQILAGDSGDDDLIYTDTVRGAFARRFEMVPAATAAWTPKVGDRVRFTTTEPSYGAEHTTGTVVAERVRQNADGTVDVFVGNYPGEPSDYNQIVRLSDIEPLPVAAEAQPAALTIEAGKFYKTRDGRKVGPVTVDEFKIVSSPEFRNHWYDNGLSYLDGTQSDTDLIALWEQPAVAVAASNDNAAPAKFKVGDRVKITATDWPEYISIGEVLKVVKVDDDGFYPLSRDGHDWLYFYFSEGVPAGSHPPTAIVALIENGQPKPATRPYVHTSQEAAAKEADRLASVHKGQQFGVYVLTTTSQEPAPTYGHEWQRLAVAGRRIDAIKELRSVTGMQLKSAKDVVEHFIDYPYGQLAA